MSPDQQQVQPYREAMNTLSTLDKMMDAEMRRQLEWHANGLKAMSQLATRLPSLAEAPGASPWDAGTFLDWLCSSDLPHGEQLAGRFALAVWNSSVNWMDRALARGLAYPENAIHFDLFEAVSVWDRAHLMVLEAWVSVPFRP